jgi:hypothetical protein
MGEVGELVIGTREDSNAAMPLPAVTVPHPTLHHKTKRHPANSYWVAQSVQHQKG